MTAAIQGYHAHVYFDATTLEQARALCEEAARRFAVTMGRVHQQPVGPHPGLELSAVVSSRGICGRGALAGAQPERAGDLSPSRDRP